MTFNTCTKCGIDSHDETCWLCDIEQDGRDVYFSATESGKIVFWGYTKNDLPMKVAAKDFTKMVRKQYPRGK